MKCASKRQGQYPQKTQISGDTTKRNLIVKKVNVALFSYSRAFDDGPRHFEPLSRKHMMKERENEKKSRKKLIIKRVELNFSKLSRSRNEKNDQISKSGVVAEIDPVFSFTMMASNASNSENDSFPVELEIRAASISKCGGAYPQDRTRDARIRSRET
ncbi:hypothetical protein TNCV_3896551 [Trichonephila clavipes]|nr:hypothetical protein TNCV_3896551 [Trichonephila clavipes]